MGRPRAALALVVTAWLGLAAMALGGSAPERLDLPRSADTVVIPGGSLVTDVVSAAPDRLRADSSSKRADALRVPLAVILAFVLVQPVRKRWGTRALVPLGAHRAWIARAAAPRGPPAAR